MIYCSTRRIIRIGSSTATTRMPPGLPAALRRKILVDNPLATYAAAQGGRAMNIEVAPAERAPRRPRSKIVDCDFHPEELRSRSCKPFLSNQWWEHLQTYGTRPRHGYSEGLSLSEDDAAGVAPRRLAAGRRPAGERSRFHEAAAPRLLRHRVRDPEPAVADRAGRPERRVLAPRWRPPRTRPARRLDRAAIRG